MPAAPRLTVAAVSVVLAVAAATYAPRPAFGATPPTVTSVSTQGDRNRGDVLVTMHGTALTAVRTVTLEDLTNGGQETVTLLSKAKDRIVVRIPSDLAPGEYRFNLAPKKGTPAQVNYSVPAVTVEAGFTVTQGQTIATQTITANLPTNTFSIGSGFAAAGGQSLTGVVTGKNDVAPQFRFTRDPTGDFMDIGLNPFGAFTVENKLSQEILAVEQDGLVRVGGQNGSTRLTVNGPQYGGYTAQIHAHPADDGYLAVSDGNADVFFLESTGINLLVGNALKPGGGSWGTASDARLKKDVAPLTGALDSLLALRSVSFEYLDPARIHETAGRHVGFIAQEVEKVLPDWVGEGKDGMKFVAPKGFESLAVGAFRELRAEKDAQIEALSDENAALRERLAAMETQSAAQDARLAAIEKALGRVQSPEGAETNGASSPR